MHFTASLHGIVLVQLWLKDDPQENLLTRSIVFDSVGRILRKVKGCVYFTLTLALSVCVCVDSEIGQLGFRAEIC